MRLQGSGCSVAWLARLTGGQEVESSNLSIPTIFKSSIKPNWSRLLKLGHLKS